LPVANAEGHDRRAAILAAAADQLRERIQFAHTESSRSEINDLLDENRFVLSEASLALHFAKGRALHIDDAIACALGERPAE
jgi:hypothetical protein